MRSEVSRLERVSRARSIRDAVFVYLILFTSGSVLYMQASNKYLILVFLVVLASWFLLSDRRVDPGFVLYLIIFASFLLLIHFYTGGSLKLVSVIGTTMELLLAYLILKIVGANILESYINTVVFLAIVSIFGYLTDSFLLFEGVIRQLPPVGDIGYEGVLYVYRNWGEAAQRVRNKSIFYEPGAYQFFVNTGLFILVFARTGFSSVRKWIYASILLVTLLTTFSTTGFLIFGVLSGLVLMKSESISASGKAALVGILVIVIIIFSARFQYIIFDKIGEFLAIQDVTDSRDRRSFDMIVDLEIAKRHFLGLGHEKYFKEFSGIGLIQEGAASSNGITSALAIYGLPFFLFLFASYFAFFNKYFTGFFMKAVPFFMLLLFIFSEAYYTLTPFCLALIAAIFACERMEVEKEESLSI